MEITMKNRIAMILSLSVLVVFIGCKNTNQNKNRGQKGLEGTWTAEVLKWNNPGDNSLTLTRKAEITSKDISSDDLATQDPSGQTPQSDAAKKAEDEKQKKEEEAEKKAKDEAAKESEKSEEKTKVELVLKLDTKEKKVSGSTTVTKGKETLESGSFSGSLEKGNFSKFSVEYTGKDKDK